MILNACDIEEDFHIQKSEIINKAEHLSTFYDYLDKIRRSEWGKEI